MNDGINLNVVKQLAVIVNRSIKVILFLSHKKDILILHTSLTAIEVIPKICKTAITFKFGLQLL